MSSLMFIPLSISATSLSRVISLPHTFCLLKLCIYRSHSPFSSSIHCLYLSLSLSVSSAERNYFSPQYLWFHLLFRPLFSSMSKPRQMSHRFFRRSLTAKMNRAMYRMCSQVKNYQMKQQQKTFKLCVCSQAASQQARLLCYQSVSSTKCVLQDFICSIGENQVQNRTSTLLVW